MSGRYQIMCLIDHRLKSVDLLKVLERLSLRFIHSPVEESHLKLEFGPSLIIMGLERR